MRLPIRLAIIGNGGVAKECARLVTLMDKSTCLMQCAILDATQTISFNDFENFCINNEIKYKFSDNINSDEVVNFILSHKIDYIFSINNHQIFGEWFLRLFEKKIINFHNGPLPKYGGLNVCTWAIFNGELEHGVTWHYVAKKIDAGDIICSAKFKLEKNITALQLMMKCIKEGVILFNKLLKDLVDCNLSSRFQAIENRTYYYNAMTPNNGLIDFSKKCIEIDRLIRSLNYHPLVGMLKAAHSFYRGKIFHIESAIFINQARSSTPGKVIEILPDSFKVKTGDGVISPIKIRNYCYEPISTNEFISTYNIKEGCLIE